MFFNLKQLVLVAIVLVNLTVAIYVVAKNPRRIVNRAFFLFVLGIALWSVGIILLSSTGFFAFDKLILYGGMIMITGLLFLSKTFPDTTKIEKRFWFYLFPIIAIFVVIPFNVFIESVIIGPEGSLEPVNGPGFPFLAITVGVYIVYSIFLFIRKYLKLSGLARLQMQYLFLGVAIFILTMFIFNVFLPAINIFTLNLVGPMSSIIFVSFIAYAVVRHQLMDIRIVIQKGAIYSAIFAFVVGFYLALLSGFGYILQATTNTTILVSAGLAAVAGIFGVPPLERYFRKITDKIFFKDKYDYAGAMHELSEILNRNLELEPLVKQTIRSLEKIFRAEKAGVFLTPQNIFFGHGSWSQIVSKTFSNQLVVELGRRPRVILRYEILRDLDEDNFGPGYHESLLEVQKLVEQIEVEVVVPIVLDQKLCGLLILGKRLSGDPYTTRDLELLRTLSYQLAVALEKAELYKKVQDHSLELEERVRERTADFLELQEEQRRMMVDVSHALQTPLTVVKGELDVLKRRVPVSKNFAIFEKAIDNVSRLTYDLLSLARLEGSKTDFRKESIDLSGLLNDLIEYFTVLANNQGVVVVGEVESGVKMVGNKARLEELITNLLSNAIKYISNSGEKKIKIILSTDDGAGLVRLMIEDTGTGIGVEDLPHIFEAFYRAGNKNDSHGSGLGLAICKAIVEKHGGNIEVKSRLGEGTKFVVTFSIKGA